MKEKIDLFYKKFKKNNSIVYDVIIDDHRHASNNFEYYGGYYCLIKEYPKNKFNYIKL